MTEKIFLDGLDAPPVTEGQWLDDIEDRLSAVVGRIQLERPLKPGQLKELLDDIPLLIHRLRNR